MPKGTLKSILKAAGLEKKRMNRKYAVIFEQAETNWAAYVPELPGCVTTGKTLEEGSHKVVSGRPASSLRHISATGLSIGMGDADHPLNCGRDSRAYFFKPACQFSNTVYGYGPLLSASLRKRRINHP